MGRTIIEKVKCDVCGTRIDGDYMTVEVLVGVSDVVYCVCLPRTAPINPCGNILKEKLEALFPKRQR